MNPETFYRIVTAVYFGIIGLCVGSFLNVVIYRLPNKMSIANPPSHCPKCGYRLRWYDNIPIFSYLFLGGKCRKCRSPISPRYIFVEISNMILWLLCLSRFGFSGWRQIVMSVSSVLAVSVCICIAAIDFEHKIIFDRFHIIMICLALAFTFADESASLLSNVISAFAVFAVVALVGYFVSAKVGGEALGGGDVKFSFVSALFLGWKRTIPMWIIASVSSLIYIGILKIKNGKSADDGEENTEYPFGPFIVLGFIIMLLFGNKLISAYYGLFGL